jgi:hypothetical protein
LSFDEKAAREGNPAAERFFSIRADMSALAWNAYTAGLPIRQMPRGVETTLIDRAMAAEFLDVFARGAVTQIRRDDFSDGYFWSREAGAIASLNECNEYREIAPDLHRLIKAFLRDRSAEIEQICGHPWRVASVRAFSLMKGAPSGRHTDGWPLAIKKLFILPNGATPTTGTTWFKLRTGEEITVDSPDPFWMIFENSVCLHALVAPLDGKRPTIEVDLLPSAETNSEPIYAGTNGWYPWFPTRDTHDFGTTVAARFAFADPSGPMNQALPSRSLVERIKTAVFRTKSVET